MRDSLRHALALALGASLILGAGACAPGPEPVPDPPSPSRMWQPHGLEKLRSELNQPRPQQPGPVLRADRVYGLGQLIDIAQRNNPQTRLAWLRAREASLDVAVAQSTLYPLVKFVAGAYYEKGVFPISSDLVERGYFTAEATVLRPEVVVEWLLWDFGRREAAVEQASQIHTAARLAFNAAHQEVIRRVTRNYYLLSTMQSREELARSAGKDARVIEQAARMAREHGLATQPELLQAVQNRVRADWDLEVVLSSKRQAQVALAQAVGADPGVKVRVKGLDQAELPRDMALTVEQAIDRALNRRQDLLALVAQVRAARAAVRSAEAGFMPRLVFRGNAGPAQQSFRVDDLDWVSTHEDLYGGAVALEWPLFTGFRNEQMLRKARNALKMAEEKLAQDKSAAVREVWQVYSLAQNALGKMRVAQSLLDASRSAYDAMLASYRHGLATLPELLTAQVNLAAARGNLVDTKAEIKVALANLAFITGGMDPGPAQGDDKAASRRP